MQTGDRALNRAFHTIYHALGWFSRHNPARQKFQNILEPTWGSKPDAEQFAGKHPSDLHASILGAIEAVLAVHDYEHRLAFSLCDLGQPHGFRFHPVEAAELLDMSPRSIYRMLRRVHEDLEHELKRRDLIEAEEQ